MILGSALAAVCLGISCLGVLPAASASNLDGPTNDIPPPTGPFNVGLTQHVFNYTTPPSDPSNNSSFFLITLFYPTLAEPNSTNTLPYIDSITAGLFEDAWGYPEGSLESVKTRLMWQAQTLDNSTQPKRPTLVFLPGGAMSVSLYTALLSDLASHGYLVIGIDHPGEAPYLPIPYTNGTEGVYGIGVNESITLEVANEMVRYRVEDVRTLLSEEYFPALVELYGAPFNTTHYGLMGHSIGVPVIPLVMAEDERVVGAVGLDGSFNFEAVNETIDIGNTDLKRPLLLVGSELHDEDVDPSTRELVDAQSGWWGWLKIEGFEHLDFSDIGVWEEVTGLEGQTNTPEVGRDLPGTRKMKITREYVRAFWDYASAAEEESILEDPSENFKEVVFIDTSRQ